MNYPGTRIATSILLCIASFGAFASDRNLPVSIAPLDTSLANDPFTVTGTVRSPAGEPLAGVPIRLWEQERPEALWDMSGTPAAVTDAEGAFQLQVPSRHAHYYINIFQPGYEPVQKSVFQSSPPLPFQLVPLPVGDAIFGTVTRDDKPTRATVHLLSADGVTTLRIETDGEGKFAFPALAQTRWHPSFYAESEGLYSPIRHFSTKKDGAKLRLEAPGSLEGRLVTQDTEAPIAGCTVEIQSNSGRVTVQRRVTDSQGHFIAEALPPGSYTLRFAHEDYGTIERPTGGETLQIVPGKKTDYLGTLISKLTLTGKVVSKEGHPVAGAWVGFPSALPYNGFERWPETRIDATPAAPVQTDALGNFVLRALTEDTSPTIQAYHMAYGLGKSRLTPSEPDGAGQPHIILGGAIRVRGTVLNETGGPIAHVVLGELKTDEHGHFDSGFAALSSPDMGTLGLSFLAPRPKNGIPVPGALRPAGDTRESFYLHRRIDLPVQSGQEFKLEVSLKPTRAITFSGRAIDPAGELMPGTQLSLKCGDLNGRRARPHRQHGGASLFTSIRPEIATRRALPFTGVVADKTGHWSLVLPVETSDSWIVAYGGTSRPYGVLLYADHPERGQTTDVPIENLAIVPDHYEVDVHFPALSDSTGDYRAIRVVDSAGKPLENTRWRWHDQRNGPTMRSDSAGNLFVKYDENHKAIVLVDESWSVISPEYSERVIRESMLEKSEDDLYRIVLGAPGRFDVYVRYPDGVSAEAGGGDTLRHGKTRYTADPGHFVIENMKAGIQTVSVDTSYGFQKEFVVDVPASGQGELLVEVPRPTCTVQGQLRDEQGQASYRNIEIRLSGGDITSHERPAEDGTFSFDLPPGAYWVDVRRNNIPCILNAYREIITVGPEDNTLAMDLAVTTPTVVEGASNLGRLGKLIVQVTGQNGAPEVGLLMSADRLQNGTLTLTGQTDQSGYHVFEHVSAGQYTLNFTLGSYLGETWKYLIPLEEGATRRCDIKLDEGARVTGSVVGPSEPTRMKIKLMNIKHAITCTVRPDASGRFQLATFPMGPALLHYEYDGLERIDYLPVVIGEDMDPIEIILSGGRISGSVPDMIALRGRRGHIEIWELGEGGKQCNTNYDGLNFMAEFLEDGDYEVRFVQNRKTIAVSKALTIQDGATMDNVALESK